MVSFDKCYVSENDYEFVQFTGSNIAQIQDFLSGYKFEYINTEIPMGIYPSLYNRHFKIYIDDNILTVRLDFYIVKNKDKDIMVYSKDRFNKIFNRRSSSTSQPYMMF